MRHSWIFEILSDLRVYAAVNGLPRLALKAVETEEVARAEIADKEKRGGPDAPGE
jgi:hypothetical protein